ncbi:hypothetical protein DFR75_101934 [Nocardia ignorata]|uniref:Uncharacterized protein n=1 Tax=Nocardia ignorata TaxID=145285 RepID=A0A4V3CQE2_NOCIG|nr:hypothetical protein DFR75_101934 [Nocardia ignorata]
MLPIAGKAGHAQPAHVLEEECARAKYIDLLDRPGEEITLIVRAELLTSDGKRRAGYAPSKEVD